LHWRRVTRTRRSSSPYPPGGTNDIILRVLARKPSEQTGQSFIVENRPVPWQCRRRCRSAFGAGWPRADPVTTGHTIHPSLYSKLTYDIRKDLAPITQLTAGPLVVAVNPSLPVNNVGELIQLAKSKPGTLNYASAGNGSSTHLATELLSTTAGIKMNHIPYQGSGPAMNDVIAGHAQVVLDFQLSAMPHIKSGKLRRSGSPEDAFAGNPCSGGGGPAPAEASAGTA
jgi:tripartite-type tricarboxylate transporter receptor subunit TctC